MISLDAVGVVLLIVGGTIVTGLVLYVGWLWHPLIALFIAGLVCWRLGTFLLTPRPGDPDYEGR